MPARLTPLAVSVLALLSERPMHPYEMCQLLRERHEDRIVKVRPGSLYHAVERLAVDEHIGATGTERAGNRPERTTYTITASGRSALAERLAEMLRVPVNEYPQFPLAISEAHNVAVDELVPLLIRRADALDTEIDELETIVGSATDRGVPEAYWIAADYLRTMRRAERDWLHTLIHRTKTKDLTWPPQK